MSQHIIDYLMTVNPDDLLQKLIQTDLRLEHIDKEEPLLRIVDLLASSKTDMLCARDEAVYPRISNRVTALDN